MPDVRLKIEGLKDKKEEGGEVTEISDNDNAKSGKKKQKQKGRIHEVRYMDAGEDVDSDVDDLDESEVAEFLQKKGISDDDEKKKTESEGKKRSKKKTESVGKKRRKSDDENKKSKKMDSEGKKMRKSKTIKE
ncbi:uncharacterized protein LOC130996888 [Salvia miltiorrhiza]|uniref:uncharacterized protein LOC130996888 n=1 Tax=Salvia miltiorrhiza TaxID=226208 RepID=UPI0025ACE963|nr:uncharacterized protein LOC130996888 [Salvia miltiorrhiza]